MTFQKELTSLINRYSKENDSNTPDFILAEYINNCLKSFSHTIHLRDQWYGFKPFSNLDETSVELDTSTPDSSVHLFDGAILNSTEGIEGRRDNK